VFVKRGLIFVCAERWEEPRDTPEAIRTPLGSVWDLPGFMAWFCNQEIRCDSHNATFVSRRGQAPESFYTSTGCINLRRRPLHTSPGHKRSPPSVSRAILDSRTLPLCGDTMHTGHRRFGRVALGRGGLDRARPQGGYHTVGNAA